MNYIIIYRNDLGRFRTSFYLEYQPQVGNFIIIKGDLYRIDSIEIEPFDYDTIKKIKDIRKDFINIGNIIFNTQNIILYCSESKSYKNKSRNHVLENLDEIEEGI